jgi:hypothetical protein
MLKAPLYKKDAMWYSIHTWLGYYVPLSKPRCYQHRALLLNRLYLLKLLLLYLT